MAAKIDAETADRLRPWFQSLDFDAIKLVESGPVCWLVRNVLRQGAMTVAPFVFYGRDRFDAASLSMVALLAHELHHVEQYRRYGHAGFLLRYLRDLASRRFQYSRDLPLEAESYQLQDEVTEALRAQFP
jgi:uncharacterized protein DUF4157